MSELIGFLVFGGLAVVFTLLVLFTRNVIHAAYGLAGVLLSLAGVYVLLNAEFLAVVQIFMYAGGVVIILVFGIMLTNRDRNAPPRTGTVQLFMGVLLSVVLLFVLVKSIFSVQWNWVVQPVAGDQVRKFGELLLTDYLLAFELIGFLLLAALVAAAYLAKKSAGK
jgi:NADH:ubiquinone oxidoreductase subunit 6 (subunit J)